MAPGPQASIRTSWMTKLALAWLAATSWKPSGLFGKKKLRPLSATTQPPPTTSAALSNAIPNE
eukprot:CAMPEP_0119349968 /NCGR_PEP_ID=MMETSP1333-20130426/109820_1 /TAXON_ID=418940 /ORGANISM="Scyphosphaera apsteinii, Strain RCC1455" /LENGTH=62 /DNA_ID=CAMNT_0007362575 /DNA_START=383 /DNA_END=571 /DNA_ORIENTATION=-